MSHFAHYPDPHGLLPPCGRRTHGANGADHLYVKSATKAWLRQQGHTPRYHFIDRDDAPVGSVVDIDLNGQTLRIHMDRSLPPDWDADDVGELILGPGVPVSPARLARLGYVNRVKFASDGSTRVLEFGTEVPREGTRWGFSVSDCEITADGRLKTPVVAQIWVTEAQRPSVPASPSAPTARANLTALDNTEPRVPHQIGALIRRIHSRGVREPLWPTCNAKWTTPTCGSPPRTVFARCCSPAEGRRPKRDTRAQLWIVNAIASAGDPQPQTDRAASPR
ncbi:hypothetical protein [Streptomyces lavendulocolor]|uniref:hypothetical protein n=1 Tax=Streptomyces lavendulocolor TaxID=67316 RepID=UPI003C2E155E